MDTPLGKHFRNEQGTLRFKKKIQLRDIVPIAVKLAAALLLRVAVPKPDVQEGV